MKKSFVRKVLVFALFIIISTTINSSASSAASCTLSADLINQDPYPAIAGEYVDLLFQISGVGNCGDGAVTQLVTKYPFSLDESSIKVLKSGTYTQEGSNYNWNVLYKVRIDENTIEGDHEIELRYDEGSTIKSSSYRFKKFDINIESGITDFEIHVQDYNIKERNIVFEILNVGNQDIEALTVEIPKQENIVVRGSNRNIVGDLDSSEYTTADFEAIPSAGDITIKLYYTDSTNERRIVEKKVNYDPTYFTESIENKSNGNVGPYITVSLIIVVVVLYFVRRHKKKKKSKGKSREFSI